MPARKLWTQDVPSDAQTRTGSRKRRRTDSEGTITGGVAPAQSIALQPGEQLLTGQYRGQYSDVMAGELEELFDAPGYDSVPYYLDSGTGDADGYYVLRNVDAGPLKPQSEGAVHEFDGVLERVGTRRSHWRAVKFPDGKTSRSNDFGSDQTAYVGVPAAAQLVRWWDGEKSTSAPSPVATRTGQWGDVEIYDYDAAPYSSPTLLYSIPYDEDDVGAARVWDTRGNASPTDANGIVQWSKVYKIEHEFAGEIVLTNDLLRVTLDDNAQTITAEEWDSGTSSWSAVALGTSDWAPVDVDVATISPIRVDAQILFEDTTGGSQYALDASLARGDQDMLFVRPENATSTTPSGLQTLLSPIAQTTIYDVEEEHSLVRRSEVRL